MAEIQPYGGNVIRLAQGPVEIGSRLEENARDLLNENKEKEFPGGDTQGKNQPQQVSTYSVRGLGLWGVGTQKKKGKNPRGQRLG